MIHESRFVSLWWRKRTGGTVAGEARKLTWTFLTNHAHVLVCIAEDPQVRARDIATRVGITERAAQSIIADLAADGYLTRTRIGRRNRYQIHPGLPLRHPLEADHSVGDLLRTLGRLSRRASRPRSA